MGILTTYRQRQGASSPGAPESLETNFSEEPPAGPVVPCKILPGPAEPPCPCLECWSPTFWRSRYGGPLRCAVCDPWPTLALVGSRWTIVTRPEGALEWMACPRWGERAGDRDPPSWTTVTGLGIVGSFFSDENGDWLRLERLGVGDV